MTLSNTGTAALTFTTSVTGAFAQSSTCNGTVAPNATCLISVTFTPTALGAATGTLDITTNDPLNQTLTVTLSGNGVAAPAPVASIAPTTLTFLDQVIGTTSGPQTVTLSNTGTAVLTFTASVTGAFAQSNTCNGTVAPNATCLIGVTFTPTALGAATGTLDITTNDPLNQTLTVTLSGNGVAAPAPVASIAPTTLTFLDQVIGTTSGPQTVTLSNTGTAVLTFTASVTGAFAQSNTCNGTVAPNATCLIGVTFTPTALGAAAGTLSIATNDPVNPNLTVTLSGNGIAAPVLLAAPTNLRATWQIRNGLPRVNLVFTDNAPNGANSETGFVVERSVNGGAFAALANLGPRNNTGNVTYNDTTVAAGNGYAYRVAAVKTNVTPAVQSAWSNTATIPPPPAQVANVTANCARVSPTSGNARCTVSWDNTDATATGFRIQRANNAGFAPVSETVTQNLGTTGVQTYSWTSNNINRNTSWYFRVQSFNATGTQGYVNATPFPFPAPIN